MRCCTFCILILMRETIDGLWNKFRKCRVALESEGLRINLGKAKGNDSGSITNHGLVVNKVCPHRICG